MIAPVETPPARLNSNVLGAAVLIANIKRGSNETAASQFEDAAGLVRAGCDEPLGGGPPERLSRRRPKWSRRHRSRQEIPSLKSVTPPWMISVLPAVIRRVVSCEAPFPPSMVRELRVAVGTSKVTT